MGSSADLPPSAEQPQSPSAHRWRDAGWMAYRAKTVNPKTVGALPINVYEISPDTCMMQSDGISPLPTEALARELSSYVKQMGYTHVATPADPSPDALFSFVDTMHEAGIGVILHWSPEIEPDTPQEEIAKSVLSLVRTRHLDSIRFDADEIAERLFLRFGQSDESTVRDRTADLLCTMSACLSENAPDVLTILCDSRTRELSTSDAPFSLRYDRAWTEDTLVYFRNDPLWRKYEHGRLTLPLSYALGANYLLPISRGDVALGHGSLLDRMPGEYHQKFANVRLAIAWMMLRPGKKQLFMGCEIGTFREWATDRPIEWFLTDHKYHAALQQYCAELNHFYLENPALWELDASPEGFAWIDDSDEERSILSFRRTARDGSTLIAVFNCTPIEREDYRLGVPREGAYREVFHSDAQRYGGEGRHNAGTFFAGASAHPRQGGALTLTLPPLSVIVLRREP